ncbi:MAG: hypothetical protein KGY61_08815, partial [Desulfobacterales bacterium]|nr:hypothetical protein [Desulfobacterales bacterium]
VTSNGPPVPDDSTPPVISISNPIEGKTYYDQLPLRISWTVSDPESEVIDVTADFSGFPASNNDRFYCSKLGENVLTVWATNEVGLTSEKTVTFNVNSFKWLPPIRYQKGSSFYTEPYDAEPNSTLPIKFTVMDEDGEFVSDPSCKVVVEGTTAEFFVGEGDTSIRISEEPGEEPLYVVNLHTNFKKCDYGFEAGNEYFINVYFDNILAAKTLIRLTE